MRKVIEAFSGAGLFDIGMAAKSMKGLSRKKLVQDCLYYERKILRLLRRLQSISEGVEDENLSNIQGEIDRIAKNIEEIEKMM